LRKDFTQSAMHLSNSKPSLPTIQISLSQKSRAESLRQRECLDLSEALEAIELFLTNGPDEKYQFDNFRGYDPHGRGEHIGRSSFWLSKTGASLLAKNP
jgi:hypothetical protein